jgi:hypothetical protein
MCNLQENVSHQAVKTGRFVLERTELRMGLEFLNNSCICSPKENNYANKLE